MRAVAAVFASVVLATGVFNVTTSRVARAAAADCIASPRVQAPKGSHWYYRMDRITHRRCWFMGPAGAPVIRHAASPQARPPAAASRWPAVEPVLESGQDAEAVSAFLRWLELPKQPPSNTPAPESTGNGDSDDLPNQVPQEAAPVSQETALASQETLPISQEMNPVPQEMHPVPQETMSPAPPAVEVEAAAQEPSPDSADIPWRALALVAGMLPLAVAVRHALSRYSTARRHSTRAATLPREMIPPLVDRSIRPTRSRELVLEPPRPASVEAYDVERILQQLSPALTRMAEQIAASHPVRTGT
jgi:hypothetical protein